MPAAAVGCPPAYCRVGRTVSRRKAAGNSGRRWMIAGLRQPCIRQAQTHRIRLTGGLVASITSRSQSRPLSAGRRAYS